MITNQSSGRMGVLIAQAARFRGAQIKLIHGPLDLPNAWLEGLENYPIQNAEEIRSILKNLQPSANAIVMAAAIADVKKRNGAEGVKADKKVFLNSLKDSLEEVPDLLQELVSSKSNNQVILGFAALSGSDIEIQQAAKIKKNRKGCDLLLANPIDRINQGFGDSPNGGVLIGPNDMVQSIPKTSKIALAHQLIDSLVEVFRNISSKN